MSSQPLHERPTRWQSSDNLEHITWTLERFAQAALGYAQPAMERGAETGSLESWRRERCLDPAPAVQIAAQLGYLGILE